MRTEVISLGGSVIAPDDLDIKFLEDFKRLLLLFRQRRFIIVVGGGSTARRYIKGLAGKDLRTRCMAGIIVTRLNAWFLSRFFGDMAAQVVPRSMKEVKHLARRHRVVFVGAMRFGKNRTSDGTAAALAHLFKTSFINITNVDGLYTGDPRVFKDAKLIPKTSFDDMHRLATRMKYEPGQHFVIDQHAATLIRQYRIPTYIVGHDISNLERLLKGNNFIGTTIH